MKRVKSLVFKGLAQIACQSQATHLGNAGYYSFVTMTTLGYGDIVPASPVARMCAVLQAVLGQLYLAVLVARLVGLHILHATSRNQ